jgi:hypothetical protein
MQQDGTRAAQGIRPDVGGALGDLVRSLPTPARRFFDHDHESRAEMFSARCPAATLCLLPIGDTTGKAPGLRRSRHVRSCDRCGRKLNDRFATNCFRILPALGRAGILARPSSFHRPLRPSVAADGRECAVSKGIQTRVTKQQAIHQRVPVNAERERGAHTT